MIRRFLTLLLLLSLRFPVAAQWCVGLDAIDWKAYGGGFFIAEIATQSATSPLQVNELVFVRPDFTWGVRVHGDYSSCCLPLTLSVEYSTFEAHGRFGFVLGEEQLASGPGLELMAPGDRASGTAQLCHHAVDLVGGRRFSPCRGLQLGLDGGTHYLYLRSRATTDTVRPELRGLNKVRTRFSGAGPLVIATIRTNLCRELGGQARVLGGACIGSRGFRRSVVLTNPNTGVIEEDAITSEETTALIPVIGADLGLTYGRRVCGLCIGIEAGYRTRSYLDLHDSEFFSDRLQTVSVAGPYFGLTAGF